MRLPKWPPEGAIFLIQNSQPVEGGQIDAVMQRSGQAASRGRMLRDAPPLPLPTKTGRRSSRLSSSRQSAWERRRVDPCHVFHHAYHLTAVAALVVVPDVPRG